jgi:[ribosomal protein S5]-alanine N-acetyltransferase
MTTLPLASGGHLRPWTAPDAPALVLLANEWAIWRNMRDQFPHPYTAANADFFIEHVANGPGGFIRAIVTPEGEVAGSVGLHFKADVSRRTAEVGYWLNPRFWGCGLATEAVQTLAAHAFATYDIVRLYAIVFAWNPASARVLARAGFEQEARLRQAITKDGETVDGLLWARVRM